MPPSDRSEPLPTTDQRPSADVSGADRTLDLGEADTAGPAAPQVPITECFTPANGAAIPSVSRVSVPGYEILGVLGRGGMGIVYKARHLALKRTVALKMVLAGGHAGPQELARFRIEAEAVARLHHPNIVQIYEVNEVDGHPYCALEFVAGGNLAEKLAADPLPLRDAAVLVETLARAMQVAHARNVIHRDLKPANVLLAADGTPKITDFGLARQLDNDSGQTHAGAVIGTPSYMAPEQAGGGAREAGPSVDVYALGAILYECISGQPPFRGNSVAETLVLVRTAQPLPLSRLRPKVPRDLETICLKALAKEPIGRYATAEDLAEDLRRFLADEPILARRAGAGERLWRRIRQNPVVAGLSVAVLGLAVVLGVVFTRPRPAPPNPVLPAPTVDTSADDLLKVTAELDRTDPYWRLEQIQDQRPEIPDSENGALQINRFRKAAADLTGRLAEGQWCQDGKLLQRMDALHNLPPNLGLPDGDVTDFRDELARVGSLLPIAREMTGYLQGRIATKVRRDAVSTLLPEHTTGRRVADLLYLDAMVQLVDGNRQQAWNDCRAIWNVSRVYLDEPMAIAQLVRIAVIRMSLRTFERIVANGQCTETELTEFQGLIEEALRVPVFTTMLRGERGVMHDFLLALASGDVHDQRSLEWIGIQDRSELPSAQDIRRIHAWTLVHFTEAIGIANQQPEQWLPRIGLHEEKRKAAPLADNRLLQFIPNSRDLAGGASVHQSELRTALAVLAVERYRLAQGAWPKALVDLVPAYISEVPRDPFDGQPLRYTRTEDGVVIYSVGPDGVDDQGTLSRMNPLPASADVGFRLWDIDQRH